MNLPQSTTIAQLMKEQAIRFGANEALVAGLSRLTYQELHDQVLQTARGLYGVGVRKGDHVAILMLSLIHI